MSQKRGRAPGSAPRSTGRTSGLPREAGRAHATGATRGAGRPSASGAARGAGRANAAAADAGPGEQLVRDLRSVHGTLRRDLATITTLAEQVGAGGSAANIGNAVRALKTSSPLWQLRTNCLRYCTFVHAHHGGEDVSLFPAIRRANPALGPTVDKLEADHRAVSDLLDQVESLARLLAAEDNKPNRARLIAALGNLRGTLLTHLDFEERSIIPTLRQLRRLPS